MPYTMALFFAATAAQSDTHSKQTNAHETRQSCNAMHCLRTQSPAKHSNYVMVLQCGCSLLLKTSATLLVSAEAMASAMPATAAKAQLLLDLAARKPQDGQYASWMLPLAATALLNAAPPAAPHLWLQVRTLEPALSSIGLNLYPCSQ